MPRVKQFDEKIATSKAMELFWEKGYASTSLSDLTSRLGISKGSFYDTFGSKRDIFDKSFALYRESNLTFLKEMLMEEKEVRKGIRKMFETNLSEGLKDEKSKGCFVGNTCSELGGSDSAVEKILIEHANEMCSILAEYLSQDPSIKKPQELGEFYATFMMGINQEVKYDKNKSKFKRSIEMALAMMD